MNRVADMNVLLGAFDECKKGSDWKASTQRYEANVLLKTLEIKQSLDDGSYRPKKCKEFVLSERGKIRLVRAPGIEDRVVSKAHNQQVLLPIIRKKIIYDNGASIKDRGNDYSKRRFETHIHKHFRERGDNGGYVLFADFTKFFDNIPHAGLKAQFHGFTDSVEENALTDILIDSFRPDVSYMTEEQFSIAMETPFNSLKNVGVAEKREKLLEKSLNIGSETSQSGGVYYPHQIDNYFKIVRGVKYYGRYMDDMYIIGDDKIVLEECREQLIRISTKLGLFVNHKKTQIVPLNKPFVFLKVKYILTDTGQLIKIMHHDAVVRERRRIKKYKHLIDEGRIPKEEVVAAYRSWRKSAMKKYDNHKTIGELDKLFKTLIGGF